ncbi:type VI secretion system tip protein TssI/VgrG [Proteus mirabilis]|uniref:type VI secretion system tip protein TssI/VgrG n=1 Tax=Proteus mirabilis TaxID=584 RepID=UPI001CC398B6|nr:type VI secretion system tip protein TssI/VgrG [Proteus mirabilis]
MTAHPQIHGGGFTGGQTFSENQALQAAHGALLDALGMDSLESGLVFTCTIGGLPDDTFQVTEFNLTEGLSSLFSLSISAVSALPFIDFQRHLGLASSLTVKRDGVLIRKVNGILAGAVQGNTDGVKTWYHFDIRPEMWVMTLNQDSRIFQHQSVPTILKTLLDEAHVKADCQFYREDLHPERLYTTQKRESAFDFWCRLAFEEGINFWFEEEQLFYSDEHMGMTAGIHLTYNPQADTDISDSTAMTWQYGEYLCVDETIHKDNNFVRPSYPLSHENKIEQGGQHSVFESYGRFQLDDEGRPLTQVRFEQLRNGSKVGQATTNCFALMPGKIFTLSQHPHQQSASASANRVTAHPLIHGGGFTGGQTFAENQALQAAHGALLDALGMDSLESGLVFTCTIGGLPDDTFQITEFNLTEGLSSLFSLSISAVSALPFIDFQRHLGLASSLTVKRDGVLIRKVNGILAGAVQGNTDGVKTWYHFDIRPEMWVMTLNQDSRIFQHQSVPTILKTLLDEAHVKADCQFYREDLHPERLYTTQKRESAFDFWCRLAFEEGINFWFEEEQLFYSDEHMGMTAGIHLTYNPQADTDISDSTAMTWQYGEYLCVDETIHKDNNFVRPSYPLSHENKIEQGGQHSVFESYGRFQLDDEGRPLTQVRFEQLRNGSKVGQATTNCFALMPGKIFTLSQHPHLTVLVLLRRRPKAS